MSDPLNPQQQRILEEGFDTIFQEGVRSFTVESLAGRLGVSKKTIYKFFPSKEVLMQKIVSFVTGRIENKFREIIERDDNPVIKFSQIMEFILAHVQRFNVERMAEIKNRYPHIWRQVEEFRLARRDDFHAILSEAQEQGYVRGDIDVRVVATLYMNIINSTFQPEFFIRNNLAPSDTIRMFLSMVTEGLYTEEGVRLARDYAGQ